MATAQQIQQHDQLLNSVANQFDQGLGTVLDSVFAELANTGVTQDRTQIARAFAPVDSYLLSQTPALDTVVDSIVDVNSDLIPAGVDGATQAAVEAVKTVVRQEVSTVVETERNRIVGVIVLAAIAGVVSTDLLRQTQRELRKSRARIATAFTTGVFKFNTVITRLRAQTAGVTRYRYVGGTIDTTRDFCRQHNNRVYTEAEIRRIWRRTWSGKAPGDPMVVRGGYNCRHHWIPVGETDE